MTHFVYGLHSALARLEQDPASIQEIWLQHQPPKSKNTRLNQILQLAEKNQCRVIWKDKQDIDRHTKQATHQGVLVFYDEPAALGEAYLKQLLPTLTTAPLFLILDGVQDPHNLGACLRTALGAGVDAVIAPKHRAVGMTATVRKVACGAAEHVPFIQVTNLVRCMEWLKQQGVWITGATLDTETSLYGIDFRDPCAIVIGSEGKGARHLTLKHCDYLAKIPMGHQLASLNASVASGVFLFEVVRQRQ